MSAEQIVGTFSISSEEETPLVEFISFITFEWDQEEEEELSEAEWVD